MEPILGATPADDYKKAEIPRVWSLDRQAGLRDHGRLSAIIMVPLSSILLVITTAAIVATGPTGSPLDKRQFIIAPNGTHDGYFYLWWTDGGSELTYTNEAGGQYSYLAVYGWTRDPLVEYYVLENFGTYDPRSQGKKMGSVSCNGGQYELYQKQRLSSPGGWAPQYWSINRMGLGSHDFMIVAVEGYWSSGQATIRVDSAP
ncbi:hypothetical protein DL770_011028 [Monosporascus sp. CRB-9-2]|nr:hypothetical protein DL770_011028 [Monosporascus sp. CRB-9-2]